MPDQPKFLHQLPIFSKMVAQLAQSLSVNAYLIEKDYWLMHSLWGLPQQGWQFELKGGTSLSNGYGIIERFSEDIDIRFEPPFQMESDPVPPVSSEMFSSTAK